MEKDMVINQVRLVYDYAYAELEKSVKSHTAVDQYALDRIVAGLFLIVRDTLGESWHLKNKVELDEDCVGTGTDGGDIAASEKNCSSHGATEKTEAAESGKQDREESIFGYPISDWKRVLDENSVDCPGKLAAFLEGFEKYRRVVRNHGIKNGHEELDERLSILDEIQSDHKEKEA